MQSSSRRTGGPAGLLRLSIGLCAALAPLAAYADDYSLSDPVPDQDMRAFCTDRPTKGTGPCTVDAGHLQIESDVFNTTLQNSNGVVTDTYLYTNPNFRL